MEPDLAAVATESMQAAPVVAGADNEKEREKSALLEQMMEPGEDGAGEGVGVDAPEPAPRQGEAGEQEAEDAAFVQARQKAHEALSRDFPDALVEGSELAVACREELAYLQEAGSPLADDPDVEYKIARRMTRLLGLNVRPVAPEPPAPKAAPRRSIRPLPAGGTAVESPATALERRVAGAKSTNDMLSLLREIGTPFEALLKR